jgi:hypothetical protein
MPAVDPGGGSASLVITTQPECAWDASTSASWISGLSPTSGQGTANIAFRIAANDGASSREGMIVVNGEQARVSQRAPCRYDVGPSSHRVGIEGGAASIRISTDNECTWTAAADVSWISLASSAAGSGNGTVSFTVAPNQGEARSGTIGVANQRSSVTQVGVSVEGCNPTFSPTSQNLGAAGGAGIRVSVTAASPCQWIASSNATWISITSGAITTGNGTVVFSVAANTGPARTGTLTIAERTFTVTQAAGGNNPPPPSPPPPSPPPSCSYSISSEGQSLPVSGGTGSVNVTTTAACAWTASSNASWITITSGGTGTGNGSLGFLVLPNVGGSRNGTLTIASHTFTVTQAAGGNNPPPPSPPPPSPPPTPPEPTPPPCSYSISSTSESLPVSGGTRSVNVLTTAACAWTAASHASWITITSGGTGTGNGSVGFLVLPNVGGSRNGTLTIASRTFTVTQAAAAPCNYSISPNNQRVGSRAGTGSVSVETASHCAWTASSNDSWITVTSGASGTGDGTVRFSYTAFNGNQDRRGSLTVAGRTAMIRQEEDDDDDDD